MDAVANSARSLLFRSYLSELRGKRNAAGPAPAPYSPPGVAFVGALAVEDDAFERLYVAWFEVLDREWLEQKVRLRLPPHSPRF